MSSLRAPGLGPIVGHTTESSSRIWIRAEEAQDSGADIAPHRRTLGVIAIVRKGGRRPRSRRVHYFRLRREYDRTGTFTLGDEAGLADDSPSEPLQPDLEYEVRVGTLTVDDPNPNEDSIPSAELAERLPDPRVWWEELLALPPERSEAILKTFPSTADTAKVPLSFIVGSCRYPGLLWQAKHSDAIFEPMHEEAQGNNGRRAAEFVLMVGDQIYADMLNRRFPIVRADTFEEFQERYHTAFGSLHMRRLLRHVPTYMILDDHEIEDNWRQDRICTAEKRALFQLAINAYRSYQWVHGPTRYGDRLFYDFACGGYPFFVLDTRTQRFLDDVADHLDDNHLLGRPSLAEEEPSQLDFLLHWLEHCQKERGNVPKFIVSSSVFVPNPVRAREGRKGEPAQRIKWKEESDSWPAFPTTRRAILKTLIDKNIQNVVFVSGDIHCSNVAEISFSGSQSARMLKAFSITSSAFYWPFPFADGEPSSFVHDSTAEGQEDTFDLDSTHKMNYRAWNFTQVDNYCRVDVDPERHAVVIRAFNDDGDLITEGGWFQAPEREMKAELLLAQW